MPKGADRAYFRVLGLKAWVDGENDCRTGFMYAPYEGHLDIDPPGGRGTLVSSQADVDTFVGLAHGGNKFAMLHCSGDAAIDICLNAYEGSVRSDPTNATAR
jgi:predicted amidohydrolase YtcJ